jgi:hypothetical protein
LHKLRPRKVDPLAQVLVLEFRLPLRLQGIPRVIVTIILHAKDHEDIDVRDMNNQTVALPTGSMRLGAS